MAEIREKSSGAVITVGDEQADRMKATGAWEDAAKTGAEADETAQPKKRGRPPKTQEPSPDAEV